MGFDNCNGVASVSMCCTGGVRLFASCFTCVLWSRVSPYSWSGSASASADRVSIYKKKVSTKLGAPGCLMTSQGWIQGGGGGGKKGRGEEVDRKEGGDRKEEGKEGKEKQKSGKDGHE
jgi:hypothetical protein